MAQIIEIRPLASGTTEEMIRDFVEEAAGVEDIRIIGGFQANVTLYEASESDTQRAIDQLNDNELNGRYVRVEKSRQSYSVDGHGRRNY